MKAISSATSHFMHPKVVFDPILRTIKLLVDMKLSDKKRSGTKKIRVIIEIITRQLPKVNLMLCS